jgi:glycosyltransferase involved in cell wall biosynthesis
MRNLTEITIVIRSLERGGTETHLLRTLPVVAAKGLNIEVFCFERPGELAQKMKKAGVKVVTPPLSGWLRHVPLPLKPLTTVWTCVFFLFYLFYVNPRVVHFFLPAAYLLLGPVALAHRAKKVMSRRSLNRYLAKYPEWVRKLELFLHSRMTVILANSNAVLRQLHDTENVAADKLMLIYNGVPEFNVPVEPARTRVRRRLGIAENAFLLLSVANLLPYKGYRDLIEACGLLEAKSPELDWGLVVVGNDSIGLQKELEVQANKLSIRHRLHFVGKQTEIEQYLAAADTGILVSHEEGFSNAVLEGMSAGLPMIVSDVGGNPEAVLHERTGFVVPAHAPERLADAIINLFLDRDLAQEMGKVGKERVIKKFSIEKSAIAYEAIYLKLIN